MCYAYYNVVILKLEEWPDTISKLTWLLARQLFLSFCTMNLHESVELKSSQAELYGLFKKHWSFMFHTSSLKTNGRIFSSSFSIRPSVWNYSDSRDIITDTNMQSPNQIQQNIHKSHHQIHPSWWSLHGQFRSALSEAHNYVKGAHNSSDCQNSFF